jgi:hypothetical protein
VHGTCDDFGKEDSQQWIPRFIPQRNFDRAKPPHFPIQMHHAK